LNRKETCVIRRLQTFRVAGAERKTEYGRVVRIAPAEIQAVARFGMQRLAHAGIGFQIESEIGFDLVFFQESEVAVCPAMSPDLEKGIGQKLLGSLSVVEEPFPARKERRPNAETPQSVNAAS
jgi:hypothetical protein